MIKQRFPIKFTIKKNVSIFLCLCFSTALFAGCNTAFSNTADTTEIQDTITAFDNFTNTFFCAEVATNTINLHYTLSKPENYGITDPKISLGDYSDETIADDNARYENYMNVLKSFDYSSLAENQQLTYDILYDYFKTELAATDLILYSEPLSSSTGVQSELPILYEEYTFYDEDDITDYLELISLTDEYFEQVISFEQKKADAGLFMSDSACKNVITQCEAFVAEGDNHYLIATFNNKIDAFTGLSQTAKDTYKIENETIIKEHIIPAYQELADALTSLLGSGTNAQGLCYLPDGKEYYEYLVYYCTGTDSSIEELEQMIGTERSRVLQEAADLMTDNPELWDECNEATLNALDSTTTLNNLKEIMLADFPAAPDTSFTVHYIDESVADYLAPAFYVTSPIDDFSSNSIYINEETDSSSINYFTTLAHEGYPGHLYQTIMSYDAGISDARALLNYPGYVEGWATYVEMKSYSYAGLDEDVANLLQLNQSALLSLYASTDLGIHYDGWTLDDTLGFWKNFGITDEATISEIYQYIIGEPANYLKYYVGYLEFNELKAWAKTKYLHRYNEIAFHQAILDIGPAPFSIIKEHFDEYYSYE